VEIELSDNLGATSGVFGIEHVRRENLSEIFGPAEAIIDSLEWRL